MRSAAIAVGAVLAATVVAQPHHHQHRALHNRHQQKRDDVPVVWVTDTMLETEIVDITTTIWVSAGYVAPTPTAEAPAAEATTTEVPAQFFEAPAAPSTTQVIVTEVVPAAVTEAVPTEATTLISVAAAAPTPDAVTDEPETTTTPVAVDTPAAVSVAAPVETSAEASSSSSTTSTSSSSSVDTSGSGGLSTGDCGSVGALCGGDMTYYDTGYPGYGSCGDQTDGTKVAVVALPWEFMGTASNSNPFCHRHIRVQYGGKEIEAEVVDKCMGCKGRDIDLSHFAFDQLADESIGRTHATWYFID